MLSMGVFYRKQKLAIVILLVFLVSGCGSVDKHTLDNSDGINKGLETQLFGGKESIYGNIQAPIGFDWRQYEGVVLNFIVEDNINANILSIESEKFTEVTGIKVNVKSMDFDTMIARINMDFIAEREQYDLIYVDPYQTLNRFFHKLENLNIYQNDASLPHLVGGLESFKEGQVEICSYFRNRAALRAIPFDSTNMIFFYRKDIFTKYKKEMIRDLGYEPKPGSSSFTWDKYIEVSKWITDNVPSTEVKYGSLSMNANHNSIYTEFSNIFNAYGGDYFADENVSGLGIDLGSDILVDSDAFRQALSIYKKLAELNPRSKENWTWSNITNAFKNGQVAMMVNWDENIVAVENKDQSLVAGKVGYAILPYGSVKSSNIYGGSGIGINSNAALNKKLAAWLFIVWATSPQIQMKNLLEGGTMPVRKDIDRLIEADYISRLPHASAMMKAQSKDYIYYRPKMREGYSFENIMINNLYQMVNGNIDEETTQENIKKQWNQILLENGKVADNENTK